jgi:ribosomal protein L33
MRPKVKLTSRAGLQSDYLDKMQKNKIEKLMRFADEEKNRVQAKKD